MTNELATGCDRCLTLQSGANTAKHCNQGLLCVGLFKQRCAESAILSSSITSYSDQCLRPSPEENGLGFAKVGLGLVEGTRELLFTPMPYIAVYSIREGAIEIWRIYHTSQDRG